MKKLAGTKRFAVHAAIFCRFSYSKPIVLWAPINPGCGICGAAVAICVVVAIADMLF